MPTIPKITFPHIDIDAPIDAIGNSVFGLLGDGQYQHIRTVDPLYGDSISGADWAWLASKSWKDVSGDSRMLLITTGRWHTFEFFKTDMNMRITWIGILAYYKDRDEDKHNELYDIHTINANLINAQYRTICELEGWDPDDPDTGLPGPDTNQASPIILDLNGDGVKTIGVEDGVHFDHDGDRFAEKTGWVSAEDAFLVWDRNKNGLIDDGSELFGNNYTLKDGSKAANGFEALKEFDSNGDGIVDARDDRWGELQLWQDRNGDGKVDDGELIGMEDAGVAGLNVDYQNKAGADENGNKHSQVGSFIRDDGTTGSMADVWFLTNRTDTVFLDEIDIDNPDLLGLPKLRGYGNVPSLRHVIGTNPDGRLRDLVEQITGGPASGVSSRVWDMVILWTGASGVTSSMYPKYRGDARKLFAMEQLTGTRFGTKEDGVFVQPQFNTELRGHHTYFTGEAGKLSMVSP